MNTDLSALHLNDRTVSLTVSDGRIAAVKPVPGPARAVVLPLPANPHVHLDKTFTIVRCRPATPGLFGAIEAIAGDLPNWSEADLRARAGLALADRHDLRLDFHVDEGLDPMLRGFDHIVALTAWHRMAGRVLCGHACALAVRPEAEVARLLGAAAAAGVALTVLPTTNMHLQDMQAGRSPRPRGLAPMQEVRAAGVAVLLGADNVADPFYPRGTYDQIEVLRLAALAAHLDLAAWLDSITTAPARAMGLPPRDIAPGQPADFILIEGADRNAALRPAHAERSILRAGQKQHHGKKAA